jgi:response regulator RpfG family c-di-GMP phosphodiesterase
MDPSPTKSKPRVLFVDDEERLLEGVAMLLRKDYEVVVAPSGGDALRKFTELSNFAVVVSDFRMPQMNGAEFLHEVMMRAPTATRILLTGEAGVNGARDAINKGQIFRFLTKPCPPDELRAALEAGVAHHRLMNTERVVMKETLLECISALMEVLSITNPVAFGRAQRIKGAVTDLAARLECGEFWQLDAAALLSQIGYFAVSPDLAEKIYYGRTLTHEEQKLATAIPANAQRLFEHIPRLEPVIQILVAMDWTDAQIARLGDGMIGLGARILGVALEFDLMTTKGRSKIEALQQLRAREARFGAKVLEALNASVNATGELEEEVVLTLREASPGMQLCDEIRNGHGTLLVPIGFILTQRLIERIAQIAPESMSHQVRVKLPRPSAPVS